LPVRCILSSHWQLPEVLRIGIYEPDLEASLRRPRSGQLAGRTSNDLGYSVLPPRAPGKSCELIVRHQCTGLSGLDSVCRRIPRAYARGYFMPAPRASLLRPLVKPQSRQPFRGQPRRGGTVVAPRVSAGSEPSIDRAPKARHTGHVRKPMTTIFSQLWRSTVVCTAAPADCRSHDAGQAVRGDSPRRFTAYRAGPSGFWEQMAAMTGSTGLCGRPCRSPGPKR